MWVPIGGRDALRDAAVEYASWGWRVAPAHYARRPGRHRRTRRPGDSEEYAPAAGCSCAQRGCTAPGAHPVSRDWLARASTVRGTVEFWWWQPRPWNVLLVAGEAFDVWTVPASVARGALRNIEAENHPIGPVAYGPAGWQFFSRPAPGGWRLPRTIAHTGRGGYLLAPPSESTGRVRWWRAPFGGGTPRLPPWESTLDALLAGARSEGLLSRLE
jgi:hypothetical protein